MAIKKIPQLLDQEENRQGSKVNKYQKSHAGITNSSKIESVPPQHGYGKASILFSMYTELPPQHGLDNPHVNTQTATVVI